MAQAIATANKNDCFSLFFAGCSNLLCFRSSCTALVDPIGLVVITTAKGVAVTRQAVAACCLPSQEVLV